MGLLYLTGLAPRAACGIRRRLNATIRPAALPPRRFEQILISNAKGVDVGNYSSVSFMSSGRRIEKAPLSAQVPTLYIAVDCPAARHAFILQVG